MAATVRSIPEDRPTNAGSGLQKWEIIIYIVIFLLAIFTRFYALGDRVMSHDESLHTRYSWNLFANGDFQHTPLMHGPVLFHTTAFFYSMFGDNDFSARIYTALLGIAIVMFPLLFRRWIGPWPAMIASALLLISPLMMYYNRYIRHDTPSIFFGLIMAYAIFMYLDGPAGQRRRAHWLALLSLGMIFNLGSKETAFIYIAIFGSALTLYWVVRLLQYFRGVPGKTAYYASSIAFLMAGVACLAMVIVLSIIPPETAAAAAEVAGGWFGSFDSRTFIIWTLLVVGTLLAVLLGTMLWAFRGSAAMIGWREILTLLLAITLIALVFIVIEEASHLPPRASAEVAAPTVPGQDGVALEAGINQTPIILWWIVCALIVGAVLVSWRLGWWRTLHRFAELDVLIVMGTLILPWLTPFITKATGVSAVDYSPEGIGRALLTLLPGMAVSAAVGLVWNWRRWLLCVVVFHAIFAFFFTTMFTNINGLATGMIGSLGYWLEQQGVRRGSQPQYYYLILIMPFYEFLPVIGSGLAMLTGLTGFWRFRRARLEARAQGEAALEADDEIYEKPKRDKIRPDSPEWLRAPSFMLFMAWLGVFNLIFYTLAGEKMPWLGTHLTLPLIFLTAWYFGGVIGRIDWARFRAGGWLYLLLFPLLFYGLFQVISPFLFTPGGPFQGLQQPQLAASGQWLAVVAVTGLAILGLFQVADRTGGLHLRRMFGVVALLVLSLLTTRSALMASFINYDLATEYLVYAHGAPAIKWVLDDIEELSLRTTGGMDLSFSYDNETSWPYSWYFRNFPRAQFFGSSPSRPVIDNSTVVVVGNANRAAVEPLLEDRFFHFEYIRLWWPMQDYYNLTPTRVTGLFDFSAENPRAAQLRRGLFDIWWSRDYTTYGQAVGRNFNVTQWPLADRMHVYVRKDVAAQVWDLGVGDGLVSNPLDEMEVNVCTQNWLALSAAEVIGGPGVGPGQFSRPMGVAVDAEGRLYVADEVNSRISIFGPDGAFERSIGQDDGINFTRPNGIAVASDGQIVVADTWNFQVQSLSPDGTFELAWGERGEFGMAAQPEPFTAFWGPRAVVVGPDNRVYVADTGNKRVRVYTETGQYVRDIGSGGGGPGQLDEPVGLALHPDGRLFVADTWNRRVSVFDSATGAFLYTFVVRGWYEELGNRPYVAVDGARDRVYVTDPDAGRVLVYDTLGNCLGSFGQASRENPGPGQFTTVGGIAVDAGGNVYIADAGSGRVLIFAPPPFEAAALDENFQIIEPVEIIIEETEDEFEAVEPVTEETAEATPEVG